MTRKILSALAFSLIISLILSACNTLPESADTNIPLEEITFSPHGETSSKAESEISAKENTDPPKESSPDKTTDKSPDTKTEPEEKTEATPEESDLTAEAEITSTATAAGSSEISPPVTAGENDNTPADVQTSEEPVSASAETSSAVTEPAPVVTTTPEETAPTTTAPQITAAVTEPALTEPVLTEPAAEEPPLTGGAYNQRYCTETESEFAEKVFELTNLERAKEGLPAFEKMDTLKNIALTRAWELTVEYRADHSRPDGSTCTGAFNENGIIYGGWAENIAAGQDTPEGVVEAWMNSPSHRAAILNEDYTHMGVGYYYIKDDYQSYYHFWTQEFYHY